MNKHTETSTINTLLFSPVPSTQLGLFRILWGLVMLYYFGRLSMGAGEFMYLEPIFQFKYPFFEWVTILPDNLMYVLFYAGTVLSLMVCVGLFYKQSSKLLFLVYTYLFLLDLSYWNNHYYAYMLLHIFFMFVDAHKSFSFDKKLEDLDDYVPRWQLLIFQFQFVLIYFYGGLSKLQNYEWLTNNAAYSLIIHKFQSEFDWSSAFIYWLSTLMTYGGLLFDLSVGFLLLHKRYWKYALLPILAFNFSNSFIFNIGSFPYAMLSSFVLFIPISFFERYWSQSLPKNPFKDNWTINAAKQFLHKNVLLTFVVFQLLFPFRSLFYEGSVFWTAEGKLGAWHMMAGSSEIQVKQLRLEEWDDEGVRLVQSYPMELDKYLSKKQIRTLGSFPFVIPQIIQFLKEEASLAGFKNIKIKGEFYLSKNYKSLKLIVDPDLDLCTLKNKRFGHNEWLLCYPTEDGFFAK